MSRVRPPSSRRIRVVLISALTLALPFTARTDSTPPGSSDEPLLWMSQAATGERRLKPVEPGTIRYKVVTPEGVAQEIAVDGNEQAAAIVELSEPPLAAAIQSVRASLKAVPSAGADASRARLSAQILARRRKLDDQHQRVRAALSTFEARAASQKGAVASPVVIRHEYFGVLNAVAVRAPREVIEELAKVPGVVRVSRDERVKADLSQSVPLVGAPEAWALGLTGEGVVVAVVDTGIDYTHPDLGGCLGPGCRVLGGYDFVNQDADPKDDDGHGTHVAGIVAANGSLKGMAPDAHLLAFKVLDEWGEGTASDVIAGIERALDPDNDPATPDGADVINLSLGGSGDPDDPVSQAVDNAAEAGVVVVVAAGNSGRLGYSTIESPGCARRAITVGATNKADSLQAFSSKGPAAVTDGIKPDIVAPGAFINSTLPGGAYAPFSGTSMAAPHVAGAAALLRQRDPALAPDAVKSLLMTSARDLGLDPFAQGAGRLDVAAAVQGRTIVSPASLSLGYDDPRQPAFDRSIAVTITNSGDAAKEYAISIAPGLPAGAVAGVAPASLALGPGESGSFTFSLHVDNAQVPNAAAPPFSYQSQVRVASDGETIRVPFAFIKVPALTLTFDPVPDVVYLLGSKVQSYRSPGHSLSVRLPEGEYDVLTTFSAFGPSMRLWNVMREGVVVPATTAVSISRNEAVNPLVWEPRDERGETVTPTTRECVFARDNSTSTVSNTILGNTVPVEWRQSNMSERHRLSFLAEAGSPAKSYTFEWFQKGVAAPVTLGNEPESLRPLSFRVDVEPGTESVYVFNANSHLSGNAGSFMFGGAGKLRAPFVIQRYLLPVPDPEAFFTHIEEFVEKDRKPGDPDDVFYRTPRLQVTPATVRFYMEGSNPYDSVFEWDRNVVVHETRETSFVIGLEPYSWFGRFGNRPDEIRIGSSLGGNTWPFVGQMMDYRMLHRLPFELYQGGTLARQGTFNNAPDGHLFGGWPILLDVTPGRYTLRLHGPSDVVADQPGAVVVDATFDTAAEDPNPPYLSHFTLLKNGEPSKALDLSGRSEIRFRAYDDTRLSHVTLQFRAWTNGPWLPLFLQRRGSQYSARLPFLPVPPRPGEPSNETPVSLRLVARDVSGNALSLEMKPGFTLNLPPLPMLSTPAVNP